MRNVAVLMLAAGAAACAGEAGASYEQGDAQEGLTLEASYPESFGLVRGVRELPDGMLLVADPLSKTLQKIDLEAGTAEMVGSEGQGPGEWMQPDVVYPLPEGRSLLVDLGNARFTVLERDLTFGRTLPLASGQPGPGGDFQVRLPEGVDGQGRIYYQGRVMMMGGGSPPTHAPIMRWDPWADASDEVTEVMLPRREINRSGSGGNQNVRIQQIPLTPEDGWAVGEDGRIAIARVEPGYRLDWVTPDGTVSRGAEIDYDPVPIGTAEKEEWLDTSARRGGGVAVSVMAGPEGVQTSFSRGGGFGGQQQGINDYQWPDLKPPFDPSGVLVSPSGEAWVLRSAPAGAGVTYDVFDATGALRTQVRLDGSRRVIDFGEASVYVARFDEFDLQYLEKYSLR